MYVAVVEDLPYRPVCLDGPQSAACTVDVESEPTTTTTSPATRPEHPKPALHPWQLGPKSPDAAPHPWPSWAPAAATAVPYRLRHIVQVMRHIEVDWLMSANMACDLVPDMDDPAVELALMILDG